MSNRAFRISFDHKVSKFVIEIQGWMGLRWIPAKVESAFKPRSHGSEPHVGIRSEVRFFPTYGDAKEAVESMGLDLIYDNFTKSPPWAGQVQQPSNYPVGYQPQRGM